MALIIINKYSLKFFLFVPHDKLYELWSAGPYLTAKMTTKMSIKLKEKQSSVTHNLSSTRLYIWIASIVIPH